MNPIIDQLVMLLSTDWFLGQGRLLCLKSGISEREAMQKKCRIIVEQLLNGESDYWQISFADARIFETYNSFFSAAAECKLDVSDIEFLRIIADQTPIEVKEADSISLLEGLTQLLISDSSPEVERDFPLEFIATITLFFTTTNLNRSDIVSQCLNSNTTWDKKIRDMTSDLPDMLGDFVLSVYKQTHHFVQFWSQVVSNISLSERRQLLEWYGDTALKLTTRNLEIPHWMLPSR